MNAENFGVLFQLNFTEIDTSKVALGRPCCAFRYSHMATNLTLPLHGNNLKYSLLFAESTIISGIFFGAAVARFCRKRIARSYVCDRHFFR